MDQTFEALYFLEKNCLTPEEEQDLTENTEKQYTLLSISNPVFDNVLEYCIVTVQCIKSAAHQFGYTFFLKKSMMFGPSFTNAIIG